MPIFGANLRASNRIKRGIEMINKKMVLSILFIAFIGAASAGTWATLSSDAKTNVDDGAVNTGNLFVTISQVGDQIWSFSPLVPLIPGGSALEHLPSLTPVPHLDTLL